MYPSPSRILLAVILVALDALYRFSRGVRGAVRGCGGRSGEQGDPQSLTGLTERKPIDPPPIVQLRVREEGSYLAQ